MPERGAVVKRIFPGMEIQIDLSGLTDLLGELPERVQQAADHAAAMLAPAVHAHLLEEAGNKLHSRRKMFVDALSFKQLDEHSWTVILAKEAVWIDDGQEPWDIGAALLASPKAKTAADGSKYAVVPFGHGPGKGPAQTWGPELDLIQAIKSSLKKQKIPFGKVEKDAAGRPIKGVLHRPNVQTPNKTHDGPGQGWGKIGEPRQGPTGIPFLQGLQISQRQKGASVQREATTFRTVSSKMEGSGRWQHPGLPPTNLMQEAYEWGLRHLDEVILPQIYTQITGL